MQTANTTLTKDGIDTSNVIDWSARPRRSIKRPAPSYWEEYVETDEWYLNKLVEDVPSDEIHAALYDDDLECDSGEEGDEKSVEESDTDDSFVEEAEESEDGDYMPVDDDSSEEVTEAESCTDSD